MRSGCIILLVLFLQGCAATKPRFEVASQHDLEALVERMHEARSDVTQFVGEARLTYMGKEGRVRATTTLAVRRPGSFRYELRGPHGAAIEAFATDGQAFQVVKMGESRFIYGPATAENFDILLAFAPLHFNARGWVDLLFGEVQIAHDATASVDQAGERMFVAWDQDDGARVQIEVDIKKAQVTRVMMHRGSQLETDISVEKRGKWALPSRLRLKVPPAQIDLEIKLRDINYKPTFSDAVFILDPPSGYQMEYMGPVISSGVDRTVLP